jgi:phosphate:Na+ symporter
MMSKKIILASFFGLVAYLLISSSMFQMIAFGIAIFLVGMFFMEDGFKLFAGGALQRVLKKTTSNIYKSIASGFFATAIMQSSSLVTVIAISFVTANLMSLVAAAGVIFGSNVGTTATTWIVAFFGVKIKIAAYAMPMVIFGVVFKFLKDNKMQGLGNVLIGLGFIFLGIEYMKDGFDAIKDTIDLTQFSQKGVIGILLYLVVGMVITVVVQSSSASMAIAVTALATGQILYMDALALAVGANVGTTVTAMIASLSSNSDGKRLAAVHVIFNFVTGMVAVVMLPVLAYGVDVIAEFFSVEEPVLKLSIFHTIFNVLGILLVVPFHKQIVAYLQTKFKPKEVKAKYLSDEIIEVSEAALEAVRNETRRLYSISKKEMVKVLNDIELNLDKEYRTTIKQLYANIVNYSLRAQKNMNEEQLKTLNSYKMASLDIIEALKSLKHMQKNFKNYLSDENYYVAKEYQHIKESLQSLFELIKQIQSNESEVEKKVSLELLKEKAKEFDVVNDREFEKLIEERKIDPLIATSIINDNNYAYTFITSLAEMAEVLFTDTPNAALSTKEKAIIATDDSGVNIPKDPVEEKNGN